MYKTELSIITNISKINIPLYCFHGRLNYSIYDETNDIQNINMKENNLIEVILTYNS